MLMELMGSLPLIKNRLAEDLELKEYLSSGTSGHLDVKDQIVYDAVLDVSEVSESGGAQTFISLSLNSIVNNETSYSSILRVAIAANSKLELKKGIPIELWILKRVIKIIESNNFGLPNRPSFETADEVTFGNDKNVQGYIALFVLENGKTSADEF